MKRLLLLLLLCSFGATAQRPVIPEFRYEKVSDNVNTDGWGDGERVAIGANGKWYKAAGWQNGRVPESSSAFYESVDSGKIWTRLPNAPWSVRHDMGFRNLNDTIGVFGGDGSFVDYVNDVWVYANNTWTQTQTDWGAGDRTLFSDCVHRDSNGKQWLYLAGGSPYPEVVNGKRMWVGDNTIYRTDSWKKQFEFVANLPAEMGIMNSAQLVSFKGSLYFIGGGQYVGPTLTTVQSNARIWRSDDEGHTWELTYEGNLLQSFLWCNCDAGPNYIFCISGSDEENNLQRHRRTIVTPNGRDIYQLPYNIPGRHATAVKAFGDAFWIGPGFERNDAWHVKKVIE